MNSSDGSSSKTKIIFIGGVGRSGTTPVAAALGQHPEVYAFPKELRFITDPDGLISLKNALVDNWSFFHADFAVERFQRLMDHLSTKYRGKYPTNGLKEFVPDGVYRRWVENYVSSLTRMHFKSAWVGRANLFQKALLYFFGKNAFTELFLEESYYCSPLSEDDFFSKTKNFVVEYFQTAAAFHHKKIAVEHTPLNLIHADFLYKAIPEMKLIHVYRDPKDIASSFGTRDWGQRKMEYNFEWIADTYRVWESVKQKIPQHAYYEVCFEKFIYDVEAELKKMCDFLQISYHPHMLQADLSRHNIGRWKKDLAKEDVDLFAERYGNALRRYEFQY